MPGSGGGGDAGEEEEGEEEDEIQEVQITGDEEEDGADGGLLLDEEEEEEEEEMGLEWDGEEETEPLPPAPGQLEAALLLQRPERARLSENTRLATRYAVRIFRDIRSSLNRYLNEPPYCRTLDLTKDPELRAANLTLAAVIRKLEEQVWFETCMYFCTRGRENQRELEEDSFGLAVDEDGRKFVYFKALGPYHKSRSSSWSKKRAETSDEENLPRMYETGTEFCPYASFVKYLSKRNPLCKAFFQRPRDHCSEGDITCKIYIAVVFKAGYGLMDSLP
ncbi:hypothetical protein AV530_006295 [Patagioenas fasciata monilis]|uniref:Uncharacterized protein n=1 Tax=Patagioenas fasciata monilis TaxID=372326 RepID=A0A1V4KG40_PATFA|nr:hypothetical protein AV530_006295 [Patagioenas fasciata monilis]